LLPEVDFDPCSNLRSTVRCRDHACLEHGDDGLKLSWAGKSVYVNGPFSNLLPWAEKAGEAKAFIFLVNLDPTTKWWKELVRNGACHLFLFNKRVQFEPPPGVSRSSNPRPSCLLANRAGRALFPWLSMASVGHWWEMSSD
jgi:hypothetical protein